MHFTCYSLSLSLSFLSEWKSSIFCIYCYGKGILPLPEEYFAWTHAWAFITCLRIVLHRKTNPHFQINEKNHWLHIFLYLLLLRTFLFVSVIIFILFYHGCWSKFLLFNIILKLYITIKFYDIPSNYRKTINQSIITIHLLLLQSIYYYFKYYYFSERRMFLNNIYYVFPF